MKALRTHYLEHGPYSAAEAEALIPQLWAEKAHLVESHGAKMARRARQSALQLERNAQKREEEARKVAQEAGLAVPNRNTPGGGGAERQGGAGQGGETPAPRPSSNRIRKAFLRSIGWRPVPARRRAARRAQAPRQSPGLTRAARGRRMRSGAGGSRVLNSQVVEKAGDEACASPLLPPPFVRIGHAASLTPY